MSGSYAGLYGRAREALEEEAELKLGRALTNRERNLFRSCGTLTALESLGMKVYYADNAQELETILAGVSMEARFSLAVDELVQRLTRFLGRPVSGAERQQLYRLGNIEALWQLEQSLHTVAQSKRDTIFAELLETAS